MIRNKTILLSSILLSILTTVLAKKCNRYGYTSWDDLPSWVKKRAGEVGYNMERWNYDGDFHPMEQIRYKFLLEPAETVYGAYSGITWKQRKRNLATIGYPTDICWDHHVNHFEE